MIDILNKPNHYDSIHNVKITTVYTVHCLTNTHNNTCNYSYSAGVH